MQAPVQKSPGLQCSLATGSTPHLGTGLGQADHLREVSGDVDVHTAAQVPRLQYPHILLASVPHTRGREGGREGGAYTYDGRFSVIFPRIKDLDIYTVP